VRLEGSLDAFSLPDIFQLLSFTKKTGGLHLRRLGLHGVVYVTTGSLTGGNSDVTRQGLARRLIGSGQVDVEAMAAAIEAVQEDAELGAARALQRADAIDESVLHGCGVEHVLDTVFDLMRWPDGEFVFVVDEVNPDDIGVSVPVEDAVGEARRRMDAWSSVSTTIPSPDSVLAVVLAPPEDPSLSRDEWVLLALVDGQRPVREVVDLTGRGEYAVVSALASLVERGLLHVTAEETPAAVPALLQRLSLLVPLEGPAPAEPSSPVSEQTAPATSAPVLPGTSFSEFATAPEQREPEHVGATNGSAAPEQVVPARPEPILGRRQPEHPDERPVPVTTVVGTVVGTSAVAAEVAPEIASAPTLIERDPSVNKSLLLRLIAGVRGL
jgi:hypothetical protein